MIAADHIGEARKYLDVIQLNRARHALGPGDPVVVQSSEDSESVPPGRAGVGGRANELPPRDQEKEDEATEDLRGRGVPRARDSP